MSDEPLAQFDPIIHPPHRLRICATLEPWEEYEFGGLRDVVGVSDSVLSKQLALLQSARYVLLRRGTQGGRQRVWVRLTDLGREAFAGHVAALREIVGAATVPAAGPTPRPEPRPTADPGGGRVAGRVDTAAAVVV